MLGFRDEGFNEHLECLTLRERRDDRHGLASRDGLPLTESVPRAAAAARPTAGRFQRILGKVFAIRHLRTANARVCTSRMPCALTAILLPESLAHSCHMLQTWFPEWTRLGVHVTRGLEPRRRRRG